MAARMKRRSAMKSMARAVFAATIVAAFAGAGIAVTASPAEAQGKGKSVRSGSGASNAGTRSGNRTGSRTKRGGNTKGVSGMDLGSGR
jgi:hypothetical protein